ncbi:NADPH-dependent oxidoreductase [bacterium]|nr:NADPH-dependent oxidoreductase [bacterium]
MMNIKVLLGSTRPNRFADKPGEWILSKLQQNREVSAGLVDLRDYPMPFFNEPVSPSSATEPFTNPAVQAFTKKIEEADGFIIVTPEYNHGIPAVLKNALDYVYQGWQKKPVAYVAYGWTTGGARAVQQLKHISLELQMVPVHRSVHIVNFKSFIDTSGVFQSESFEKSGDQLLEQLLWWARILQDARKTT